MQQSQPLMASTPPSQIPNADNRDNHSFAHFCNSDLILGASILKVTSMAMRKLVIFGHAVETAMPKKFAIVFTSCGLDG